MSASSITRLLSQSSEIISCWLHSYSASGLESCVELVEPERTEPVVQAPIGLGEGSPVAFLDAGNTVNGIVRFCPPDKDVYLITVSASEPSEDGSEMALGRDPGALSVDDFLTEEEEAKILESLQDSFLSNCRDALLSTACRQFWASLQFRWAGLFGVTQVARKLSSEVAHLSAV